MALRIVFWKMGIGAVYRVEDVVGVVPSVV
jgi:hypothetical protein